MKCPYCNYEWESRKEKPVSCPSCKRRLDRPRRVVGLQIGGEVGPYDSVGMHIPMPVNPGVGVKVELNTDFDNELRSIRDKIPTDHPKAKKIKAIIDQTLEEKDPNRKLQKLNQVVMITAGITQIAKHVARLSELLGF